MNKIAAAAAVALPLPARRAAPWTAWRASGGAGWGAAAAAAAAAAATVVFYS